ncbi:nuclear transport factor 2 family protein [Vibrio sp. RE88]|uniref:nuclear transport factor 2 family protein n=1 Tax=Vibrio sp. RE88 TaxID=2607610 RepID=UPI00149356E4|nr:nuclear transport factor 2 family protein [Vibrio sp. RE88]NOH61754.1 nuclear transport factor 2 family protein [Vibrio sp. RE88]
MSHHNEFVLNLYRIVDNKDVTALAELLHPNVVFTFSNAESITGLEAVKAANSQFFASIHSMSHTFAGVYEANGILICDGQVNYVRLDGSLHSAKFATILALKDGLIHQYKIFADISEL